MYVILSTDVQCGHYGSGQRFETKVRLLLLISTVQRVLYQFAFVFCLSVLFLSRYFIYVSEKRQQKIAFL